MRRLECAGYITREGDPGDRRALWLAAIPAGERVIEEVLSLLDEVVDRWFGQLSKTEERQLRTILSKLSQP
jgi:DNA-binding MarR family transcriptional regulator